MRLICRHDSSFDNQWAVHENLWLESQYTIYFNACIGLVDRLERKNKQIKRLQEQIKCLTNTQ